MLDFNEEMTKIQSIKGYLGSAILNVSGETLYLDEEGTSNDIAYSASVFNDSFNAISESAIDIGFSDANMLEARTIDGHVFLVKKVDGGDDLTLNFFMIFQDDGNIPLAKMVIDRSANKVMEKLQNI